MLLALVLAAQVAAGQPVATCRAPGDPQQRTWSLERVTPDTFRVSFTSRALDKPRVELPLASAQPVITPSRITLSYASANGGRAIEWTIVAGFSTLDLRVNHGLEVNVERDLDPAVDQMSTDGAIAVVCDIVQDPRWTHDVVHPDDMKVHRWSEVTVAAGVARSVGLYDSAAGRVYAVQTIGWARELTRELKIIGIRGRFAWGVEAMPVFAQLEPSRIYGVGFAPVVWRWNFPRQRSWSAFAELSMGGLWTSEPIPEDTGQVNFTAHWGGGVRLWPRGGHALVIAYRFQHFSNGNQLGSNPGVNSHVILAGWSHCC
jgi:hypothetical protein